MDWHQNTCLHCFSHTDHVGLCVRQTSASCLFQEQKQRGSVTGGAWSVECSSHQCQDGRVGDLF
jgi:hypothetical protein